ncbi:homoserine dehydrogenase [Cognatilysobacter bugurensis]|uniref:Homoserine dehydrogenase n=1 Tax=Cognatilysobacter bugurensis TaxID=543356 RepID=A0A918SY50_9GAMM|nr:homoserine dehydrogenase [Lysobacter bugurensis]GHA77663.1 homoserine dehydrogenase [Lysobacter bugurensis]
MSAHPATVRATPSAAPTAHIALLGTGTVGRAVLARLGGWQRTGAAHGLSLQHVANSRVAIEDPYGLDAARVAGWIGPALPDAGGDSPARLVPMLRVPEVRASDLEQVSAALRGRNARIVIDATASEEVADRHARWLAQGVHVVTACKLGQGGPLARWQAIRTAWARSGARYGDSATVGAGLPLLRTLRGLQAGGDCIHAVAGVLSGSLGWLFSEYDGLRPFSRFVREAREAGYTEPDPRDDLSGEDVRRKLLILARSLGIALDAGDVQVESLVPDTLARVAPHEVDGSLEALDAPMRTRFAAAYRNGAKLRFVGRLDLSGPRVRATVGLESLPADDALAAGGGADNRVAITCDRYAERPLVIQGAGAGAGVTAAALLDDALRIARGGVGLTTVQ